MDSVSADGPISRGADADADAYPANWSAEARRLAFIAIALLWLVGAALFLPVLSAVLVALVLVYILYFPTRFVARHTGWPHGVSTTVAFVLFVVGGLVLLLAMGVPLLHSLRAFGAAVADILHSSVEFLERYTPDQGWLVDGKGDRIVSFNFILEPLSQLVRGGTLPSQAANFAGYVASRLFGVASSVGSFFILTVCVLTLAFYMSLELPAAFRWLGGLPGHRRREMAILLDRAGGHWSRYLNGIFIVSLIGGGTALLQLWVMGIENALFLSALSVLLYFIPIFGGFIASVAVALGVLIGGSSWIQLHPILLTLLAWLIFVVVQGGIISGLVAPKVFGKSTNFPVSFIILSLVIFTMIGGLVGALLAVPAMGALREVYLFLVRKMKGGDPYPGVPEPPLFGEDFVPRRAPARGRRKAG